MDSILVRSSTFCIDTVNSHFDSPQVFSSRQHTLSPGDQGQLMTFMVRVLDVQSSRRVIFGFLASEASVLFLRVIRNQTGCSSSRAATGTDSFESIGPLMLNSLDARQYLGMINVFAAIDVVYFSLTQFRRDSDPNECFCLVFTAALLTASLTDLGYESPKFDSNPDLVVTPVDILGEGGSALVRETIPFLAFSVLWLSFSHNL